MTQPITQIDQPLFASLQIAAEHCQYERGRGRTPSAVIRSVGYHPLSQATWKDARRAVATAWAAMTIPSTSEAD